MTPEARHRRRIRTPVLAVTLLAWAAVLVPELLRSASTGGPGSGSPGTGPGARAASHGHAHHVLAGTSTTDPDVSEALPWSFTSPMGFLTGWGLMVVAMMAPLLIPALRHAFARSLPRRRRRAVALVTVAYVATWTAGGVGLVALAGGVRALTGADVAILGGLAVAVLWQAAPLKQRCRNRRAGHPPLAAFGRAADLDALRFGATHAVWCFGSCWALMLIPLLVPEWHVGLMVLVTLWIWSEQLESPATPAWRLSVPLRALHIARARVRSAGERPPASVAAPV